EGPIREQTIYIPYAKLRAMFEKEGRGVFIPYEKFQELWNAARSAAAKIEELKPPVGALVTEIDSTATVQKDVVSVSAKVTIDVLTEGWHEIPLRLADSAIRSAKIGDEPARVIFDPNAGYKLLFEKKGKEAARVILELQYAKAFSKAPGTNSVTFDAPQAPVNRWQIVIAEPGVKVQVTPNLSASNATQPMPAEAPAEAAKETRVEAFVGSAPQVRIDWNPKAEGAAGLEAIATVQVRQEVTIDEGVMRTRAHLAYDISRADLKQLSVEVPADQNVVNVFDPNVQKWAKKVEGPIQTITIDLFQRARGTQNVTIELEKFSDDKEMQREMGRKEFIAPEIKVLGVGRQQGIVVARLGSALRGEVTTRTGLAQIDAADLPAPLAGQEWPFAYRYAALPFSLTLSVEKVRPEIEVEELVEAYVEPQQTTNTLLAVYNIQKAGVFQLELDVPEGYEIRQVQGRDAAGAAAVAVDSHHVDEVQIGDVKQKTRLVVNLSRKAMGKVALYVELQKRQDDANLLTPTGMISTIGVSIPRVAPDKVARTTGRLIVYAPESLRIAPKDASGLRAISVSEALTGVESVRAGRFPLTRELLAYAFTQEPVKLSLDAERRKPYVTAKQLVFVNVESGVAKYEVTVQFDVLYSGVKSLRVNVSEDFYNAKELVLPPGPIKDTKLAEAPEGFVALELTGDGEFLGTYAIKFVGQRNLTDFAVGKSVSIAIPKVQPIVDRTFGQIAIAKGETIDIAPEGQPAGLRPIDPQRDLMPGFAVPSAAAQALEFTSDDWTLALKATRYELENLKLTSIDRALVRMVVTRSDETAVQCLYRLKSSRQRIAVVLPGIDPKTETLDRDSLRVNGSPVPLETDQKQFFIPLVGITPNQDVLVELRFTLANTGASSLPLPEFPDDPAVQKVYLAAYLPDEQRLLGVRGHWTDEQHPGIFDVAYHAAPQSDDELLQWVREGTGAASGTMEPFATDGTRHLFSALRPEPATAGALRLIAVHKYVLYSFIVLGVGAVGLALTLRPIGQRLWWLAGLIVAVVLTAVFAPTLANAVLGEVFFASLGLVLVVWLVRFLAWAIPQFIDWLGSRSARAAAVATAVAAAATIPPAPP
ncbi:MAG TPA: hypothetical protein VMP01_14030, partial [Pirellulaceae bacterium]|nr:hypothetical protein [Pirellulaceae bacterium]